MKVNTSLPHQRVMDTAEKMGSFLIVEDLDSSDGEDSDDESIESMLLLLLLVLHAQPCDHVTAKSCYSEILPTHPLKPITVNR